MMAEQQPTIPKIQRQFEAGVKVIQNLPKNGSFKPSNELLLKFYAYYKQATFGRCSTSRPGFFDVVGRAKWDAWAALGNMSKEEAMESYVSELKQIIEVIPQTDEVNDLVQELDHFYQLVDINTGQPLTSSSQQPEDIAHPTAATSSPPDLLPASPDLSEEIADGSQPSVDRQDSSDTDSEPFLDSSDMVPTVGPMQVGRSDATRSPYGVGAEPDAASAQPAASGTVRPGSAGGQAISKPPPSLRSSYLYSRDEPIGGASVPSPPATPDVSGALQQAVQSMQQEVTSLERRVSLLEQLTVRQRRNEIDESQRRPRWWPFKSLEPSTALIILLWPVVVNWIMTYISRRQRRR